MILNPRDWHAIALLKDADGRYIFGGPAAFAAKVMWGLPVVATWLLEKGERVTTAQTSAKLDQTLDQMSQGSGGGMNVQIINNSNSQVRTKQDEKRQLQVIIDAVREDFLSGVSSGDSSYSRAIEGT